MAIGGIGNNYNVSNNYYDYQNSVNQLRYKQAIEKVNPVRKTSIYESKPVEISSSDFLKSYNSSMSDLMSSSNSLRSANTSGVLNELSAKSSNTDVMSTEANYKLNMNDSYEVTVEQLAMAQSNVSQAVASKELAAADASMTLSSSKGNVTINVSAMNEKGMKKTNSQMMSDMAKEINLKDMGVKASIVEENGKTSLKIQATESGKENSFVLAGEFANTTGLANVSQAAQDAKYLVKTKDGASQEYKSSSNEIGLGYGKISATLKSVGTANVSAGLDASKVVTAMEKLVKNYNDVVNLLGNNIERGSGVARQLSSMVQSPISEKSMAMVGVSMKKDGTLVIDEKKLKEGIEKNPSFAKDIIGGSYSIAEGSFRDAKSGMKKNVNSLIGNDIIKAQFESMSDPINMMNKFSKSSAYGSTNQYVTGLMMNYLV